MWQSLARWILKYRLIILVALGLLTGIMAFFASKVQLSYEFTNAIPTNSKKLIEYNEFKKLFGEDGNLVVVGFENKNSFDPNFFTAYKNLTTDLGKIEGVKSVLSTPDAINITAVTSDTGTSLKTNKIFDNKNFDSAVAEFGNLPFYKNTLYNPETGAQLIALRLDKDVLKSAKRQEVVDNIIAIAELFKTKTNIDVKYSGLPLIRSLIAKSLQKEMKLFLVLSLLFTAIILFLFFRSFLSVLFSLLIVLSGVIWSTAFIHLLGYKITLLTALIPPLIVVIGIPNCIYFLNKYHQEFSIHGNQAKALIRMVQKMGIVTLFTNITAAIGFGVFCFTQSAILKEFGWVAWLGIFSVFFISLLALPAIFSYIAAPKSKHTNYLNNKYLDIVLTNIENAVFKKRALVYIIWGVLLGVSAIGLLRLKTVGYIVDDLPKKDKIYTDLKFFEKNFKGIMPLEIWIDTKRKNGAQSLKTFEKIDELSTEISALPQLGKPLSMVEGLKFARQAYYNGDSMSYAVPSALDISFILPYLKTKNTNGKNTGVSSILKSFIDSTKQYTRISVSMADVGSKELPKILNNIQTKANEIFDTSRYNVKLTGTSIIFLEGSKFIINSLGESIFYAFLMILACMVFLFRSWRVVLISIVTNIIPLAITAGFMGWFGIPLKPSTVLVFSVALGITIDVTIRFLVNYKQELQTKNHNIKEAVANTIHDTGMSIVYTSLILIAGFLVFIVSNFQGTAALGYLTSITLLLAMFANLTILPAMLLWMDKVLLKKATNDPLWEVMDEEEDIDLEKLKL